MISMDLVIASAADLDGEHETTADWFDEALGGTRPRVEGAWMTTFHLGGPADPAATRLVIDDAQPRLVELDDRGALVAETIFGGSPRVQGPRVIRLLDELGLL